MISYVICAFFLTCIYPRWHRSGRAVAEGGESNLHTRKLTHSFSPHALHKASVGVGSYQEQLHSVEKVSKKGSKAIKHVTISVCSIIDRILRTGFCPVIALQVLRC